MSHANVVMEKKMLFCAVLFEDLVCLLEATVHFPLVHGCLITPKKDIVFDIGPAH